MNTKISVHLIYLLRMKWKNSQIDWCSDERKTAKLRISDGGAPPHCLASISWLPVWDVEHRLPGGHWWVPLVGLSAALWLAWLGVMVSPRVCAIVSLVTLDCLNSAWEFIKGWSLVLINTPSVICLDRKLIGNFITDVFSATNPRFPDKHGRQYLAPHAAGVPWVEGLQLGLQAVPPQLHHSKCPGTFLPGLQLHFPDAISKLCPGMGGTNSTEEQPPALYQLDLLAALDLALLSLC